MGSPDEREEPCDNETWASEYTDRCFTTARTPDGIPRSYLDTQFGYFPINRLGVLWTRALRALDFVREITAIKEGAS